MRNLHGTDFGGREWEYGFADRKYRFVIEDSITGEEKVLADIKRIEQVFENLLSNAIKVTKDGGGISVTCVLDKKKEGFYFSVADDGWGIAEEDLPHIFENFYRSPETKKRTDGSGLGLSLSRQIVRGHRGDIFVESEAGMGSRFTVVAPVFLGERE